MVWGRSEGVHRLDGGLIKSIPREPEQRLLLEVACKLLRIVVEDGSSVQSIRAPLF